MAYNNDDVLNGNDQTKHNDNSKHNIIKEGQPMGGQNFGKNNNTPAGDDKNNPSQYAGNTNAYLARTEPSEEHPEDSNFTAENQEGAPDYDKAQPHNEAATEPKPEEPKTR